MKQVKFTLGILIVLITTILGMGISAVVYLLEAEKVLRDGALISLIAVWLLVSIVYMIWYLIMLNRTKDDNKRHYRTWPVWMIASLILSYMLICPAAFLALEMKYYTYSLYIIDMTASFILQAAGLTAAYCFVRPK